MNLKKFKRKINTVDAIEVTETTIPDLLNDNIITKKDGVNQYIITNDGIMSSIDMGDYIAKEPIRDGYYRIDMDTFNAIYEI